MSAENKAVFLSYASQDAEAVERIAVALRAAGVEVWFDKDELVGGDAWDAKIRGQIKACALFVPVISANTQARREGYFRREWKLAVDRMQDMDEGVPFLLPIALEGVNEIGAFVPEVFLKVQWTKLANGEVPPALIARVVALLQPAAPVKIVAARSDGTGGAAGVPVQPRAGGGAGAFPGWAKGLVAALGVSMGLVFVFTKVFPRAQPAVVAPPPVAASPAAPKPEPVVSGPTLAPSRVALARFENLTGEPALDTAARVIEAELIRGLGTVSHVRVQPLEVSGRRAALAAARAAGAGSVVVGQYLRNGDSLELSAEVLLTEQGELFGAVGPVTATATNLRGPGLTELIERLTTGANNVAVTLGNLPTRIAAVTYARPWPRWPVAVRAQTLRATLASNPESYAEQARAILAEAPEMLRVKHDLARHLRDQGRYDEAQKLFRELLAQDRPKLAEAEVQAVVYDEALLTGDPARALQAAEALLAIRPVSDAITQVVSCLWAQNRPWAAFQAMERWSQQHGASVPEVSQFFARAGLLATKVTMYLREGDAAAALAAVGELKVYVAGRAFPTTQLLEFLALGLLGREAEQQRIVREIGAVPGNVRIEPAVLMWFGYCGSLHAGRTAEAKRWLEATVTAWRDAPMEGPQKENFQSLGIWLFEAQGDYMKAMSYVERVEARQADTPSVVGSKAILLQAMGRTAEAEALRVRLENWEVRNSRGYPAYWRARIAARAGDKARAVELLRLAVSRGLWFGDFQSPSVDLGRTEPEFAMLRGYEPYEALLQAAK